MQFLHNVDPGHKKVLVRLDLDLPQNSDGQFDTTRMEDGMETLVDLWQRKASNVTVIAHRGHEPERTLDFSLQPIGELLYEVLSKQPTMAGASMLELREWLIIKENLRFDSREETENLNFAKELAFGHNLFVNEAFATAHRRHTSIVMISKVLPTVFGFQFEKEIYAFARVLNEPARPYIFVLGGSKLETKLPLLEKMTPLVDHILVGGRLAVEAQQNAETSSDALKQKMELAAVTIDTLDICEDSANEFAGILSTAKTIVWNRPMGKFEDGTHATGTKIIADAVIKATQAGAFSLIGGGDTESALTVLDLEHAGNFSHISSGGGAMMYYLAYGTLPAIEAVQTEEAVVKAMDNAVAT